MFKCTKRLKESDVERSNGGVPSSTSTKGVNGECFRTITASETNSGHQNQHILSFLQHGWFWHFISFFFDIVVNICIIFQNILFTNRTEYIAAKTICVSAYK